jgi:biopolymer transport protein ExbD
MPIHPPGVPFRHSRILSRRGKGKRDVTVSLSLTAMVDMFTVLVIFLLQNYNATGEIIFIPKEVILPKAAQTKELKPAVVVTISNKEVLLDKVSVIKFDQVKAQTEWMIEPLRQQLVEALKRTKMEQEGKIQQQLKNVVDTARGDKDQDVNAWNKVTVQADKEIDFLTVKKVMYTVTEAGAGEINFAVTKQKDQN